MAEYNSDRKVQQGPDWIERGQIWLLGKKLFLQIKDTTFILSNLEKLQLTSKLEQEAQVCKSRMINIGIGGVALTLALSISAQRYFPNSFTGPFSARAFLDAGLILGFLYSFTLFTTVQSQQFVSKTKLYLTEERNTYIMGHFQQIQNKFGIPLERQLTSFMSQQQFKKWEEEGNFLKWKESQTFSRHQ